MGDWDSGTIENNVIYGGTTTVCFGPWTISGNRYMGAVANTICDGAFAISGGHDITVQDNSVTDPNYAQDGQIERFLTANGGGYNINIVGNTVAQNVGNLLGAPLNSPEEILPEDYSKIYEGSTLATSISSSTGSYNRELIAIPCSELLGQVGLATTGATAAMTLFILDGSSEGTAIPVTQALVSSDGGTTYFLLTSPLPQGTFDFSIAPSYNVFTVSGNTIDTSGTYSTALVLTSNMNDVQVTGDTFKGNQTAGNNNSWAIRISDYGSYPAGSSTLGTYDNRYYCVSIVTMFGVVISGNTIAGPIGGIVIWVAMGRTVPTTYGRTYTNVAVDNNTFDYAYQNLSVIHLGDGSPTGPTNS
jgi:hypothetical protein